MLELIYNEINIFDKFSILNYDTSNWDEVIIDNTDLFNKFTIIQKKLLNLINEYENKRIENNDLFCNDNYISLINLTVEQTQKIYKNLVNLNIESTRFKFLYNKNCITFIVNINSIWNIQDISFLMNRQKLFIDYINRNKILSTRFYNFYNNSVNIFENNFELLENNKIRVTLEHYVTFINLLSEAKLMYNIYLKSNTRQINKKNVNVNSKKIIKEKLSKYIFKIKNKLKDSEYIDLYNLVSNINN